MSDALNYSVRQRALAVTKTRAAMKVRATWSEPRTSSYRAIDREEWVQAVQDIKPDMEFLPILEVKESEQETIFTADEYPEMYAISMQALREINAGETELWPDL